MNADCREKLERVKKAIEDRGSLVIAYSGGVDSALLAVIAQDVPGTRSRCILLDSPVVPRTAVREAEAIARDHGLDLEIIPVPVMENARFRENPAERCYFCKKSSAAILKQCRKDLGFAAIADGINVSDTGEHRPGIMASTEEGIVHPFIEAGITKEDIRAIARSLGCTFWDKPSAACLSSRIPYGEEITGEKLGRIESAEDFLREEGFTQFRVRAHGTMARIEVPPEDIPTLIRIKDELIKKFRAIGFSYVTLDLEGYRSGSMDEVLPDKNP